MKVKCSTGPVMHGLLPVIEWVWCFPGAAAAGVLAVLIYQKDLDQEPLLPERLERAVEELTGGKEEHHLFNWSNTHECRPKRFFQPETQEELEAIVKEAHNKGAMSPYAIPAHLFVSAFPMSTPQDP